MAKKGEKMSDELKKKLSNAKKGKKLSEKHKSGLTDYNKGKKLPQSTGKNNWKWIEDRTKLKKSESRKSYSYFYWRNQVLLRDNFTCRIADINCVGQLQAHHILPWRDYVELRYEINNGITLCQAHHPRKRAEEKRLEPLFKELVSVSK